MSKPTSADRADEIADAKMMLRLKHEMRRAGVTLRKPGRPVGWRKLKYDPADFPGFTDAQIVAGLTVRATKP